MYYCIFRYELIFALNVMYTIIVVLSVQIFCEFKNNCSTQYLSIIIYTIEKLRYINLDV